jgi:hypothetical protein
VAGASWQEANALVRAMLGASDALLHPLDDQHRDFTAGQTFL